MPKQVVILSGHVGCGKTTLAEMLVAQFGAKLFKTFDILVSGKPVDIPLERAALQKYGETLDRRTNGAWVAENLQAAIDRIDNHDDLLVVLDSIRMKGQAEAIRRVYGRRVFHVHLHASEEVLTARYLGRKSEKIKELASYKKVQENRTERNVSTLAKIADIVVRTDRCMSDDVLIQVASHLGLFGREHLRLVDVLVGGQYGSEGKGQVAAYLAPEYDYLVRVGGPNAGHKVYEEPKPYSFHQLPSGTRASEAKILIGAGAVINVQTIMREIGECKVGTDRLFIDPRAMIITDEDRATEGKLVKSIGSTGQGVGAATARRIMRGDDVMLAKDVKELRPYIKSGQEVLEEAFAKRKRICLEGTQGTGLSIYHGNYPHVTSRDTTVAGCLAEAGISPNRVQRVIMVCRTYPIRVQNPDKGTSGFMSQPLEWEEVAKRSGYDAEDLKEAEITTTTKRQRRVAEFDWKLLKMASTLNAPTDIALTFVDYLSKANTKARRFEQLTSDTLRFIESVERVASAPVSLISTRFHTRSIIDRRMWG